MSTSLQLCILMLDDVAMAFKRESAPLWEQESLKGATQYRHQGKSTAIGDILTELSNRLHRKDKLQQAHVSILFTENSSRLLVDSINQLQQHNCLRWELRSWRELHEQACRLLKMSISEGSHEPEWIMKYVLPLVEQNPQEGHKHAQLLGELSAEKKALEQSLKKQQSTAEKSHADMLKAFEAEKHKLLNEMNQLRQQNAALERPGLEVLLSFLPAIFKDFWNKVRPDELAIMAGKLDTPNIPSPYHSPGMEAVLNKKRHFQQLGVPEQRRIQQFCRDLRRSHAGLQIHPEFLSLINEPD